MHHLQVIVAMLDTFTVLFIVFPKRYTFRSLSSVNEGKYAHKEKALRRHISCYTN